ncbi:MAG: rhomboid family intramembrane serine protease [Desulfovibrionales bacterium]|nr:rhomboid family intramembrane serine protease [Desulfovibrionales bacterium]
MFPLRDNIPSRHRPYTVILLIGLNVLLFLLAQGLDPAQEFRLFHQYGVVPARFFDPEWAAWHGYPEQGLWAFASHMFMHSGWLHLIFNMWTLWIFGDNVEDVMGSVHFLFFYVLCGLGALFVHMVTAPDSTVPVVGASGAIAGVMGAYFSLYPQAKISTFLPVFFLPLIFEMPAVFYLGAWFLTQVFSGLVSGNNGGGGVAWWAHIGGFVAGMLLLRFFRDNSRCYYCSNSESWKEWGG